MIRPSLSRSTDHDALGPENAGLLGGRFRCGGELPPQHCVCCILRGGYQDDLVPCLQPPAARVELSLPVPDGTCSVSNSMPYSCTHVDTSAETC